VGDRPDRGPGDIQPEAQLVLAGRLALLGHLAASNGHEINTPLTYVLGTAQLLGREIGRLPGIDAEARAALLERLAVIEDGAVRMRSIVRDLKAIAGGGEAPAGPIDVCTLLEVCANMAEHEIRHRARLVRDYQGTGSVHAVEARLAQVFLSLLVNAAEAFPEGEDRENEVHLSTRRLDATPSTPGPVVEVAVRDTGGGIAPEHLGRIFDPFFTTKAPRRAGLGLSLSRIIITALGGAITAEPALPRGTCFRVILPCEPVHDGGSAGSADSAGCAPKPPVRT
jgi:signal transduction histidine kinase